MFHICNNNIYNKGYLKQCQVDFVVFLQYNCAEVLYMNFWNNVNFIIKLRNTTQDWVAVKAGINPSAFRSSISKSNEPGVFRALKIAQVLDTTVEYLVTGIEPPGGAVLTDEEKQVLDDLKIIDSNIKTGFISAIHQTAECARREKKAAVKTG
jgi:hypothetical protein